MKYYSQDGQYSIEVAIRQDLCKWANDALVQGGFTNINLSEALKQYCEMELRVLNVKPRKIEKSREFLCPAGLEDGLKELENAIEIGLPLNPFMSKNISNVAYQDKFINDWGLFHFHLGTELDKNDPRFKARTGNLLIAYVDLRSDDTIYFLQVLPHKKSIWTQQRLIRILADNWPEKVRLIPGVSGLTENVTDDMYRELREVNGNTAVDLKDGRVVFPPNYGLTSAGVSVRAMLSYNMKCNDAERMEINISQSVQWICNVINNHLVVPERSFFLHMVQPGRSDYTFRVDNKELFVRIFSHKERLAAIVGNNLEEVDDCYSDFIRQV